MRFATNHFPTTPAALFCLSVLAACANVSPVMQTGNNSYLVSVVSHSQFSEAMIRANQDAEQYCLGMGKKIVVNHMDTLGTQFMSSSSARVQFSCYAESDPQYRQSTLKADSGASNVN